MKINLKEGSHRLGIVAALVCLVATLVALKIMTIITIPWELSDWLIYAGAIVMFPLGTYLAVRIVGWTVGWLFAGLAGNEPRD